MYIRCIFSGNRSDAGYLLLLIDLSVLINEDKKESDNPEKED